MEKLTIQSLKNIFDLVEPKEDAVLWIRDKTYNHQLYVSPTYEKIWQHKAEKLYENPESWNNYLHPEDKHLIETRINDEKLIKSNSPVINEFENTVLFRINNGMGKTIYIRNTRYILVDDKNQHVGYIGIDFVIPETQWINTIEKQQRDDENLHQHLKMQLFSLLHREFNCSNHLPTINKNEMLLANKPPLTLKHDNKNIELTEREIECLHYLIAGKSSKQTAALMNISPRTVEFHINNIKMKASCRTKLEILGKIIQE